MAAQTAHETQSHTTSVVNMETCGRHLHSSCLPCIWGRQDLMRIDVGNREQDMDGWALGNTAGTDARYSDVNGVTLGQYSLALYVPASDWKEALKIKSWLQSMGKTISSIHAVSEPSEAEPSFE